MKASEIITTAREFVGVPFRHQGRSKSGIDCVGLPVVVASLHGLKPRDVSGYPRRPGGGLLEQTFDAHVESGELVRVPISQRQAGDFLMMSFSGQPQHLAIFTGENIIHAYEAVGKVCEHRLDEKWAGRIVRVYRLTGIEP